MTHARSSGSSRPCSRLADSRIAVYRARAGPLIYRGGNRRGERRCVPERRSATAARQACKRRSEFRCELDSCGEVLFRRVRLHGNDTLPLTEYIFKKKKTKNKQEHLRCETFLGRLGFLDADSYRSRICYFFGYVCRSYNGS